TRGFTKCIATHAAQPRRKATREPADLQVGSSRKSSRLPRMVGDGDFLKSQRPESGKGRGIRYASATVANHETRISALLSQALMVSIVRHKQEIGGTEESRLRNHRRNVDGSATRSRSLTAGAAASQPHPRRNSGAAPAACDQAVMAVGRREGR